MNFDETLAFVAADEIWRCAVDEGKTGYVAHRAWEFPFAIFEGSQGLTDNRMKWHEKPDEPVDQKTGIIIPEIPDCVCPEWIPCYCGGR